MAGAPQRLFVAIDVPDDVRSAVDQAIEPLRARYEHGRWVPLTNQHVTVRFLGATPDERVRFVVEALERVAGRHGPFATRVGPVGAFPSLQRGRVLWAGLEDPDGRAGAVAGDLDRALAPAFPPGERPFTPHLTLARFDPPVRLVEAVSGLVLESRRFDVTAITLYRSHLGGGAPRYEALETVALGHGGR